ncbi:hypothetical protein K504DRAFT_457068 [Pleomassaria siparia CBS 279.74]|uniref:N-acetyltransferase domain-containing protein n=1 Tax=Pleomassaria siparia CBS 279.74 TaxID=1314801 RepID=A0A6G1KPV8_9PLEO|nr:hypothetical protein K504DRAFT_457068 [Pleomassaria siparia CBS 279.74]
MAEFSRYSRNAIYVLSMPTMAESVPSTTVQPTTNGDPSTRVNQVNNGQANADDSKPSKRRKNRGRHWKRLDLDPEPAPESCWEEDSAFPIPEATLTVQTVINTTRESDVAPSPLPLTANSSRANRHSKTQSSQRQYQPNYRDPNSRPPTKRNRRGKRAGNMNIGKVAGSEYVPPHMRGQTSQSPEYIPPHVRNRKPPTSAVAASKPSCSAQAATGIPTGEVPIPNGRNVSAKAPYTPQKQFTTVQAASSSGPQTGTTVGHRPDSPPSPPSSPVNCEDETHKEPDKGTLNSWRVRKEPTPEQSKRVSLDASVPSEDQPKGIKQSSCNANGGHNKPISPPKHTTPKADAQSSLKEDNAWGEWKEQTEQQKAFGVAQKAKWDRLSKNPNWTWNDPWPGPSGQGTTANKKGMRWPKNRDMKAVVGEQESDGGISCESNSDGDPNYDIQKLVDHEGNWMPPPEVWCGRNSFRDRHFGDTIEAWIDRGQSCGTDKLIMEITSPEFLADSNGDMVPRDWIPAKIENESPQQFWRTLPTRAPSPLSDVDFNDISPWWESYINGTTTFLTPLKVPDAEVDKANPDNRPSGLKRTSEQAIKRRNEAAKERTRRIMEKRNRPIDRNLSVNVPELPDNSLKPTANIYLRPVQPADTPQITDLYNHYVRHTISANEFNNRSTSQIARRVQDIVSGGLPWIVAVQKGNQSRNQHFKFVNEKIVGFVSMDDHTDQGSMYRYTFEMELYVHPEYVRQGVAKCLLDKLLDLVDNVYKVRGGYDWSCPGQYLKSGASRIVKTILLTVPHTKGDSTEINWISAFLKSFNFRKSGHLLNMGFKNGSIVDTSIFQYTTSEPINANAPPTVPL